MCIVAAMEDDLGELVPVAGVISRRELNGLRKAMQLQVQLPTDVPDDVLVGVALRWFVRSQQDILLSWAAQDTMREYHVVKNSSIA